MAGRYERVNAHDEDDEHTPRLQSRIPTSPPPSFHSRASSVQSRERARSNRVDATLAHAFDSADDSDDDADDTQRLVRGTPTTSQATSFATPSSSSSSSSSSSFAQLGVNSATAATTTARSGMGPDGRAAMAPTAPPPSSAAASTPFRVYGAGIQSDGVFSNLSAKPERGEEKEEQPPTYEQAAADAAPPYWETTIMAPGFGGDEVYIDGMPVGSLFSFVWNAMIAITFQPLIGFLLTYLLHSTHAAKNGSRGGLGVTMIQTGFQLKSTPGSGANSMGGGSSDPGDYSSPPDPNAHDFDPNNVQAGGGSGSGGGGSSGGAGDISGSDWLAYILMIVGWFILIRAISDYIRARRHEQLVLQSPDRGLGVAVVADGETPDRAV